MPQLVTLPSTASIEEVCEVIRRDGGVIVEDMLSSELVDQFMADIQPYLDRTPYGEARPRGPPAPPGPAPAAPRP